MMREPKTRHMAYAFANNTTAAKTADLQLTVVGGAGCQPPTV